MRRQEMEQTRRCTFPLVGRLASSRLARAPYRIFHLHLRRFEIAQETSLHDCTRRRGARVVYKTSLPASSLSRESDEEDTTSPHMPRTLLQSHLPHPLWPLPRERTRVERPFPDMPRHHRHSEQRRNSTSLRTEQKATSSPRSMPLACLFDAATRNAPRVAASGDVHGRRLRRVHAQLVRNDFAVVLCLVSHDSRQCSCTHSRRCHANDGERSSCDDGSVPLSRYERYSASRFESGVYSCRPTKHTVVVLFLLSPARSPSEERSLGMVRTPNSRRRPSLRPIRLWRTPMSWRVLDLPLSHSHECLFDDHPRTGRHSPSFRTSRTSKSSRVHSGMSQSRLPC